MKDGVVMDPVVLEEAQQLLSPASWTKGNGIPNFSVCFDSLLIK